MASASAFGTSYAASYAGSAISSRSSASQRARAAKGQEGGHGEDLLDRRSTLENGIFGVLFTLSKENSDSRVRIRWVLVKVLIDAWQLFTTVVTPSKQGWRFNSTAWNVVSVLNFTWLGNMGYGAYLAVLYSMVVLLAVNVAMCVWVAWCFKEHKFPVVWPIKVLRVFSSVFFQVFDVTSLNLLQLGFSCRFTGPAKPHLRFQLMPEYSCTSSPHITHAVVSGLSLMLFIAIALLLNMAEVEVNPLSRRPLALGHSGAEVMAFAIKAALTLVDVFIGWPTVAACCYLALSLALAYQYIRWGSNLVPWMNYLKAGVSAAIVWCSAALMLLVFRPGVARHHRDAWDRAVTEAMLAGLAPAFCAGVLLSWGMIRRMTSTTLGALANAKPDSQLEDVCDHIDDPRDIELVARCCRVWIGPRTPDPEAVAKAHLVIKAGLAMFPTSPYMVLLHANFMIDVLGIHQSGTRRIEDARKLSPGLMCRFIMFVRQQQATQKAAGSSANEGTSMDLLGYVEYQRKQRMVIRLHREALQAMCNFWKALDASNVSFVHLSKSLGKIETSVSQAQAAYRVVLENYGNSPKLVRLYGKFLLNIKNDPWGASEYFAEAERLEEVKDGDTRGPLLPDGTPLGRMDELSISVLVVNVMGEIQVANRQTYHLFGYKRGMLEGKPMSALLAPHCARWLAGQLAALVSEAGLAGLAAAAAGAGAAGGAAGGASKSLGSVVGSGGGGGGDGGDGLSVEEHEAVVVGMHSERLAFPVKATLRRVSGVGEDTTMVAMLEPLPPVRGVSTLWVSQNGTVAACDPSFVATFGWRSGEVNGVSLTSLVSVPKPELPSRAEQQQQQQGGKAGGADADADVEAQAPAGSRALTEAGSRAVSRKWAAQQRPLHHAEGASDVMRRLLALAAEAAEAAAAAAAEGGKGAYEEGDPGGLGARCLVAHKFDGTPAAGFVKIVTDGSQGNAQPVHEVRITLAAEPPQLLVVNAKGLILHTSADLAACLRDGAGACAGGGGELAGGGGVLGGVGGAGGGIGGVGGSFGAGARPYRASTTGGGGGIGGGIGGSFGAGARPYRASIAGGGGGIGGGVGGSFGGGMAAAAAFAVNGFGGGGGGQSAPLGKFSLATELLSGYTLSDFLPPPWKDMHVKYLKSTTPMTAPSRGQWSCRRGGSGPGPTLELRSAGGKPLYMRVSVATTDLAGELTHVMRMARSSVGAALAERRLRLSLSEEGLIGGIVSGTPGLFGLDASHLLGRGLWELIEETASLEAAAAGGGPPAVGHRMLADLVGRALTYPEHSWRVRVLPPPRPNRGTAAGLVAAARVTLAKPAVMQVHVEMPPEHAPVDTPPDVFVDLWPLPNLTGVLELDPSGRIAGVLEEGIRPAGLLFGLPSQSLVGSPFEELVALPPGRSSAGDLLSLHGAKKSSLKVTKKEAHVKVGPVHVLGGSHSDGRPLALDVQVVGRPGPGQPLTAILRPHVAPLLPNNNNAAASAAVAAAATAAAAAAAAGGRSFAAGAAAGGGLPRRQSTLVLIPPASERISPAAAAAAAAVSPRASLPAPTPSPKLSAETGLQPPPPPPADPAAASPQPSAAPPPLSHTTPSPRAADRPSDGAGGGAANGPTPNDQPPTTCPGSDDVELFATPAGAPFPSPPELASIRISSVLPASGAVTGKAAAAAGRSKLAVLVRAAEDERTAAGAAGAAAAAGVSPAGSGLEGGEARRWRRGSNLSPQREPAVLRHGGEEPTLPGATPRTQQGFAAAAPANSPTRRGGRGGADGGRSSLDSDAADLGRMRKASIMTEATERISTWVASKGAYYQNSVCAGAAKGDDDDEECDEDALGRSLLSQGTRAFSQFAAVLRAGSTVAPEGVVPELHPQATAASTRLASSRRQQSGLLLAQAGQGQGARGDEPAGAREAFASAPPYPDDDAASEGGQSALSAQSGGGGGAEYRRGKRFRKLAKMMDSSQAQQVQSRFRNHALAVVALLVFCHVVCFVLTVNAIESQRASMLRLGRSGQSQRYMHRILADVRALDVISRNKTVPNLYSPSDAPMLLQRIRSDAEEVKARLNEILYDNHKSNSMVMDVLYYTTWRVWNGNSPDGSDLWTNITIWDFCTQYYTYSKDVVQQYDQWQAQGIHTADTPAGQFLIKSGPDVWRATRRVLDALLYTAVDDTRMVDKLQLVFLAVEGAFITCLSACYVAYLLRAVAAQRFKLYSTFLVVPVGLTRALASQNTNLLIDEEEDESDNEDERAAATDADDTDMLDASGVSKSKRRATLNVTSDSGAGGGGPGTPGGGGGAGTLPRAASGRFRGGARFAGGGGGGTGGAPSMARSMSMRGPPEGLPGGHTAVGRAAAGCWAGLTRLVSRALGPLRRGGRGGGTLAITLGGAQLPAGTSGKRALKYDSHETLLMMVPFVLWSALVIALYSTAVVKMKDVVDVVAVHSVTNFLAARTYRTVFFTQELAVVEDPALLPSRRAALATVRKVLRDAYYTLVLGRNAYKAVGADIERFPLVKDGLAHATPKLQAMFYASGSCHRKQANLPCPGPGSRFYQIAWTGIDSIMQEYLLKATTLASSNSTTPPGLSDGSVDFIYHVGSVDLFDGTIEIHDAHYDFILALFNRILLLHIILFLLLLVIVALFLFLLLYPLLKRVTKERRRIAELMSQLPLELDVEKLVERALGTGAANNTAGGGDQQRGTGNGMAELPSAANPAASESHESDSGVDAMSKWKAIIRTASTQAGNNLSFRRASSTLMQGR